MNAPRAKILLVEDEAIIALNIASLLELKGYEVAASLATGREAIVFATRQRPDCILMDIVLRGKMDGIQAAEAIRSVIDVPVIYLTAHSDDATLERAKATEPYGYVVKPVNPGDLVSAIEIALYKHTAEKRIRESEERYRSFAENFPGIAFQYGLDFSPVFFHGSVEAITGFTESDFLAGNPRWEQIIHPEDWGLVSAGMELLRREPGYRARREYRIIRRGGEERWVDEYIQNVSDAAGTPAFVRGMVLDISERKRAQETIAQKTRELESINEELNQTIEELESTNEAFEAQNRELLLARGELEKSESFLKSIFRAAPVGIGIATDRVLGWTNEMVQGMTGYSAEGLSGRSARVFYQSDEEFERVGREKNEQIAKRGTGTVETRWKRRDGSVIDVLLSSTPLDPKDHSKGVTFTALDITERKRMEKDLDDARKAWQEIFQAIGQPTLILDPKHRILDANREVSKAFGMSHEELLGKYCYDLFHNAGSTPDGCPMKHLMETGEMKAVEMEVEALKRVYLVSCTPVYNGSGKIQKIIHIAADITERKKIEDDLVRLTEILEKTSDLVSTSTPGEELLYLNAAGREMLGYSPETDITRLVISDLHPVWAYVKIRQEGVPAAVRDGVWEGETAVKNVDGVEIPVSQVIMSHKSPTGELRYLSTIMRDITGRIKTERDLRENEEKLRNIVEHSTNAFYSHTTDHVLTYLSPQFRNILGYEIEEALVRWTTLATDNPINERGFELTVKAIESGERQPPYELELRHKDGHRVFVEVHEAPVVVNGKTRAIVGALTDITERKKAEAALLQSEEKFRSLVETMRDGMVVIDRDNRFTYVNPRVCEMLGYSKEELIGSSPFDFLDGRNRALLEAQIRNGKAGKIDVYELEWTRPDGRKVLTQISPKALYDEAGTFAGNFGVIADITERRRAEELMLQNEKMMTIGGLAAGMAHEINNPLGIILQGVQAAQLKLSEDYEINRAIAAQSGIDLAHLREYLEKSEVTTYLKGISEAGMRAADIVTSMLQFSRRSSGRKTITDIHDLLDRTIEMASRDYDLKKKYDFRKIVITRNYGDLPGVGCVPTEIEQVMLNLLKNAAQAMSENAGEGFVPRITITTTREDGEAVIRISDNGPGIDEFTRKHLFEPFYTTKAPGEGTGLGLAVSFFIIAKNHAGTITADSAEGEGTTFTVKLPLEADR